MGGYSGLFITAIKALWAILTYRAVDDSGMRVMITRGYTSDSYSMAQGGGTDWVMALGVGSNGTTG